MHQGSAMQAPPRRAQVVVSLLVSTIMLGKNSTSLIAIIRTINRQQELEMLIGELAQSPSSIPMELMERARRATQHGPAEIELVWSFASHRRLHQRLCALYS
jgi:hypothetical protein